MERSLTLYCASGLADRLILLASGRAFADATSRRLRFLWPVNAHCPAPFSALFSDDGWPVEEGSVDSVELQRFMKREDFLKVLNESQWNDDHLQVFSWGWLMASNDEIPTTHPLFEATVRYIDALEPVPDLLNVVEDFQRRCFRPRMIGVHLRRGDFMRLRKHAAGNTIEAMDCVDRVLEGDPDAGILLCSNDGEWSPKGTWEPREGVFEKFRRRYGDRVVATNKGGAHRTRDAESALIDMYLLRRTHYLIGTVGSKFGMMAVAGRGVPSWFVAGPSLRSPFLNSVLSNRLLCHLFLRSSVDQRVFGVTYRELKASLVNIDRRVLRMENRITGLRRDFPGALRRKMSLLRRRSTNL